MQSHPAGVNLFWFYALYQSNYPFDVSCRTSNRCNVSTRFRHGLFQPPLFHRSGWAVSWWNSRYLLYCFPYVHEVFPCALFHPLELIPWQRPRNHQSAMANRGRLFLAYAIRWSLRPIFVNGLAVWAERPGDTFGAFIDDMWYIIWNL